MLLLSVLLACKPPVVAAADPAVVIPIATLNDFHGALYEIPQRDDPTQALGGLPWVAGAVDTLRAEHPDLVLLDAGDSFQGSWPVNATQGMGSVRAFNLLGVDVTTVGNHDFDYGAVEGSDNLRGALHRAVEASDYTWVAANIEGDGWTDAIPRWTLVERDGVKIGVVGVITQSTPQVTLKANVEDLRFTDPAAAVVEVLPELRAAGAQAVVVLAHLEGACDPVPEFAEALPDCLPDAELGEFLQALPEGAVDLVIAGHSHTLLAGEAYGVPIVEARAKGMMLGQVDLVVTGDDVEVRVHEPWVLSHAAVDPGCEDRPFPRDPLEVGGREVTPNAEAIALVDALEEEAGSLCDRVGCTAEALTRSGDEDVESAVGDLMADAMLAASGGADLAVANAGGLRADVPAGELRGEHLQAVMPFDNRLMAVELTGQELHELLRIGSSGAHGLLQIAGGRYAFDPEATGGDDLDGDGEVAGWEVDRLCRVEVGGEELDLEGTYRVVVTDFLYAGGDHLGPALTGRPVVWEGGLARDALLQWVASQEECIGTIPLVNEEHPRIWDESCASDE